MITVIAIILLFSSLVILHEAGHFWAARRGGVDVEEFGFGFPPKAWGKQLGRTFYSFNWLPLGGFVRLKGEDGADTEKGSFNAAGIWTKTAILLAGVGMNLLTAVALLYVLCLVGIPGLGKMFEPSFLHPSYAQAPTLILTDVSKGSPADQAGLKRGDYIISLNGKSLTDDNDLRAATKEFAGTSVAIVVRQNGQEKTVGSTLRPPDTTDGFLGVVAQPVYKLKYDPLSALVAALYITGTLFVATIVGVIQLLIHIPALVMGLFAHGVPPVAETASGPIGIIFILANLTALGWAYIILFIANISVALAAFNVLPLPALDGGRLFLIWLQKLSGKKISVEVEAKYHTYGFMALIALMVLISVYDFRKYIHF